MACNIPYALHLKGVLDVGCLYAALNAIVQRHETLRTSFHHINGIPQQSIAPHLDLALPVIDVQGLSMTAVRQRLQQSAEQPFDLTVAPLLRTELYPLGEQEHVLLLNFHRIIADGWSMGLFLHELDVLYSAALGR